MPLEIKELQITVTVNPQQSQSAAAAAPASKGGNEEKKAMLQQCIEDVMSIINHKKER